MKTIAQAIKQYQKLNRHNIELKKQMDELMQKHNSLRHQRSQTQNQMHAIKNLIDLCVITGQSPTQIVLSNTAEQIEGQVKDHILISNGGDGFYIDPGYVNISTLSSTTPVISSSTWSDSLVLPGSNSGVNKTP